MGSADAHKNASASRWVEVQGTRGGGTKCHQGGVPSSNAISVKESFHDLPNTAAKVALIESYAKELVSRPRELLGPMAAATCQAICGPFKFAIWGARELGVRRGNCICSHNCVLDTRSDTFEQEQVLD